MDDFELISKYFKEYLQRGIRKIYSEQRQIAANKIYGHHGGARSRSGRLMQALQNPSYSLTSFSGGVEGVMHYPAYIRFLDMKRLGNYRIYNRPIWGILYKETFVDLRYEFSDWLRKTIHNELESALTPLKKIVL